MIFAVRLASRWRMLSLAALMYLAAPEFCAAQTQNAPIPPATITPPSLSQQLTIGLRPINICPKGYLASETALQNLHLAVCIVPADEDKSCAAQPNAYACGLEGTECCRPAQDNPCFPGAYACSDPAAPGSGAKTACCMTR
jgi:hypothetical protein